MSLPLVEKIIDTLKGFKEVEIYRIEAPPEPEGIITLWSDKPVSQELRHAILENAGEDVDRIRFGLLSENEISQVKKPALITYDSITEDCNRIVKENVELPLGLTDNVNHPTHYNDGKIEVIEFIEDKRLNFHRGNAVKYIARAGKKDPTKEIEDLKKSVWYVEREIERLEALRDGRSTIKPDQMEQKK